MRWFLALTLVSFTACSSPNAPTGVATYRIGGTARNASVTFTTLPGSGSGPQPTTVTIPWTWTEGKIKEGEFLQVRAQILTAGTIEVSIERNGMLCQTQTVTGVGAVATVGCVF